MVGQLDGTHPNEFNQAALKESKEISTQTISSKLLFLK